MYEVDHDSWSRYGGLMTAIAVSQHGGLMAAVVDQMVMQMDPIEDDAMTDIPSMVHAHGALLVVGNP